MKRRAIVLAAMIVCTVAVQGLAAESELTVRSFDRFEFDSATARGLWGEVATTLVQEGDGGFSSNVITVEPRLVYGWEHAETGFFIPYHRVSADFPGVFGRFTLDGDGIGDVRLYGKGVWRSDLIDAGLGLETTLPTGNQDDGLGAGEVSFVPYGMAAFHLGLVDLRLHIGYRAFVAHDDTPFGSDYPYDSLVYGGGLFVPITGYIGVRVEFVGERLEFADHPNAVSFEPGFDVRIALGPVDLFIRPTGAVGLTDLAPDWGVGGGIAIAWDPQRTSESAEEEASDAR